MRNYQKKTKAKFCAFLVVQTTLKHFIYCIYNKKKPLNFLHMIFDSTCDGFTSFLSNDI